MPGSIAQGGNHTLRRAEEASLRHRQGIGVSSKMFPMHSRCIPDAFPMRYRCVTDALPIPVQHISPRILTRTPFPNILRGMGASLFPATSTAASPDARGTTPRFAFANTYARLPGNFYARVNPTPVAAPRLVKLNVDLARTLGLDPEALSREAGVEFLAGNRIAPGSEPLAMAYAGHQFGGFVPQLGDGRANLLGEVLGTDGRRYDIHLKGSGPTPFSRRGDGRAALGPVLREYIVSEAMAALGVPTARSLAALTTGENVLRETVVPGAVFVRVAASHLRVGTFQYFAAQDFTVQGEAASLRILADYAIARHYPEAADAARPYRALLEAVIARQAQLIAQWMLIGFVHGVMNTDNMAISGETIDYGPCAFVEAYDPATVFSSIDRGGRYAYANQPHAAHWNLTRLAEAMLPLLESEGGSEEAGVRSAEKALATFGPLFEEARASGFARKIGLSAPGANDRELWADLLERMAENHADFTLTFRRLCDAAADPAHDAAVAELFDDSLSFTTWAGRWRRRLGAEPLLPEARAAAMRAINPVFIPRNHVVGAALEAAVADRNFQPFNDLLEVLSHPFEDRPDLEFYKAAATPEQRVHQTFCGT